MRLFERVMNGCAGLFHRGRRMRFAAPATACVMGLAMTAASTPRVDSDLKLTAGRPDAAALAAPVVRAGLGPDAPSPLDKPVLGDAEREAQRLNAALPAQSSLLRAARPFVFRAASAADRERALRCLTQAVYYEAALEPTEGQEAVAQVVLNRVRDPNYPASVCGVVYQGAERTTGCQFSFTCDGALSRPPVAWAWARARTVAERALAGHVAARVGTATHYHADYVNAWWAPTLVKLDQIGAHIFYRWKGFSGETSAFRQSYAGREPVIDEARFARPRPAAPEMLADADDAQLAAAAAAGRPAVRTVEIDGRTRTVGVVSLGGRRQASSEEIARINRDLAAYEAQDAAPSPQTSSQTPPPPGVTVMEVEEVGRPGG